MQADSNSYQLGELSAQVHGLTSDLIEVKQDLKDIKLSIDDLKQWKAQVVIASTLISAGITIATELLSKWTK